MLSFPMHLLVESEPWLHEVSCLLDTPLATLYVTSSSPRGVILSSHRVSTRHSRQTSDTNRLFGRNKSPRQMSDLFDCTYASSYPLSQSAFELEIIRGHVRSPGVQGTYAFNRGNRVRCRTVQKALPCVVSVRKRRVADSDRKSQTVNAAKSWMAP